MCQGLESLNHLPSLVNRNDKKNPPIQHIINFALTNCIIRVNICDSIKNASLSFAGKTLAFFPITENSGNNNDLPQNRPMDTFGFVLSVTKALDGTMKSC